MRDQKLWFAGYEAEGLFIKIAIAAFGQGLREGDAGLGDLGCALPGIQNSVMPIMIISLRVGLIEHTHTRLYKQARLGLKIQRRKFFHWSADGAIGTGDDVIADISIVQHVGGQFFEPGSVELSPIQSQAGDHASLVETRTVIEALCGIDSRDLSDDLAIGNGESGCRRQQGADRRGLGRRWLRRLRKCGDIEESKGSSCCCDRKCVLQVTSPRQDILIFAVTTSGAVAVFYKFYHNNRRVRKSTSSMAAQRSQLQSCTLDLATAGPSWRDLTCFRGSNEVAITLARAYSLRAEGKIRSFGGLAALRAWGATSCHDRTVGFGLDGARIDASILLRRRVGFPAFHLIRKGNFGGDGLMYGAGAERASSIGLWIHGK
jgi:hypothetical protein